MYQPPLATNYDFPFKGFLTALIPVTQPSLENALGPY
jgi:hypothetical protein